MVAHGTAARKGLSSEATTQVGHELQDVTLAARQQEPPAITPE